MRVVGEVFLGGNTVFTLQKQVTFQKPVFMDTILYDRLFIIRHDRSLLFMKKVSHRKNFIHLLLLMDNFVHPNFQQLI